MYKNLYIGLPFLLFLSALLLTTCTKDSTSPDDTDNGQLSYIITAEQTIDGGGSFYENDNITIDGNFIMLGNWLTVNNLEGVFNSEFCSSIMSGLEIPDGYDSVFEDDGSVITPHDKRLTTWNIKRGPGHLYPDFPKDFNPDLVDKYNDN